MSKKFVLANILPIMTPSNEDYLEAIAEAIELHGHAHVSNIAGKLGVRMPSVSVALRVLMERGLIVYESYKPVRLTEAGARLADDILSRHTAIRYFLRHTLKLEERHADELACKLEHSFDDLAFEKLNTFIRFTTLNRLRTGETARVIRINTTPMRDALKKQGFHKGALVGIPKEHPSELTDAERIYLTSDGYVPLDIAVASKILVCREPPETEAK